MGLFNHFPYPDTHQLNLDWILDAVKTCVDKVTELWTYVREPGAGIQKALTDAQAAATNAQTSATSAQASSANARTSAIGAEANAANAQTSANDAQAAATNAQEAATYAANSVNLCVQYLADVQSMMRKLYPVGAVYVNYRNQTMPVESDETVIARLQALTGGTWARAGSRGQPVTETGKLGMATIILTNDGGDYKEINFNIYVRTA